MAVVVFVVDGRYIIFVCVVVDVYDLCVCSRLLSVMYGVE